MTPRLFHPSDAEIALPAARLALQDLRERSVTHRYVHHVRSSQAFALNLFAPLEATALVDLLRHLGHDDAVAADPLCFEYDDPADRMGEASARSRHLTQVDVLLRGRLADGRRVAALIEVKLGEEDFGHCSAFANPANPRPDVCGSSGMFGGSPDACFQVANHGQGHRAYTELLAEHPVSAPDRRRDDGGCWTRTGRNQPMRNLALANLMVRQGEADIATYALCAPEGHRAIWRRYEELTTVVGDSTTVSLRSLPAEIVAAHHPDGGRALMDHYPSVLTT